MNKIFLYKWKDQNIFLQLLCMKHDAFYEKIQE